MIDHQLIKTGFDMEIQLGGDYFLTVIQGAYDAGEIPSAITMGEGIELKIQRPIGATIIVNPDDPQTDLEITFPSVFVDNENITVGMRVIITGKSVQLEYRYLDQRTHDMILLLGALLGQPELLTKIETQLATRLKREIALNLVDGDVAEMQVQKLPANGEHQAAFGIYLNLNLKIAPQSSAPETEYIPRGNLANAASFLPADRSIAVGVGRETFPRIANNMWHGLGVVREDGSIDHPVMDGDTEKGAYKSVSIRPENGTFVVTVRSEVYIDYWPDADVTAVFHFTPKVVEGALNLEIKLVEFDADTGILGDVLGFFIGGVLGALIGLMFGPAGILIGAAIGGVGGIATVEITEAVLEGNYSDQVENEAKDADISSIFSSFPVRQRLFSDRRDPFFIRHYEVLSVFDETTTDSAGMSFAGHGVMTTVNEPVETSIVDKARSYEAGSWHGIKSLTYRLASIGDVEVPISEVLRRIPLRQLACVVLKPTQVRRENTIVKAIRFASGVDFYTSESVALQDNGILVLTGFQLIHPCNSNPYYRAWKDECIENNFESLPIF